ncbi:MAG: hypothetical protein A3F16_08920 [Deltaproteobacteria bacterium RIFCSPHIGHO2_12_FULL_43_9]|nr:MAG: hypothetical protein A3F16_08920 [Deltaproteobacteria bacterium RIFCSPHIGHO2_12_FULL_43_9]
MKKTVTFTELRNNAKKYFDDVEKGNTLEIYRHGKPVAVLSPSKASGADYWKHVIPIGVKGASLSKLVIGEKKKGR